MYYKEMTEQLDVKGEFYIPGKADSKVKGRLVYDTVSSPTLELYDDLEPNKPTLFGLRHYELILGETSTGQRVTLYKCYCKKAEVSFKGFDTFIYTADYLFFGFNYDSTEEIKFLGFSAEFQALDEWMGRNLIKSHTSEDKKVHVLLEPNVKDEFDLEPGIKCIIESFVHLKIESKKSTRVDAVQKSSFSILSEEDMHFLKCFEYVQTFANFLSLTANYDVHPTRITFLSRAVYDNINLIFKPVSPEQNLKAERNLPYLYYYRDVTSSLEEVIRNWYQSYSLLRPVYILLFNSIRYDGAFNENQFLNIIQAVETFHRRLKPNFAIPKAEHEVKLQQILAACPEEHKEWLKERLNYSNEPNLRQRLRELIEQYSTYSLDLALGNAEEFIKVTLNSRNYYTHYDKRLEGKALKGKDLRNIFKKLKILLYNCILFELKYSKEEVERISTRLAAFEGVMKW